jgi:hypothetical protein
VSKKHCSSRQTKRPLEKKRKLKHGQKSKHASCKRPKLRPQPRHSGEKKKHNV